MQNTKLENLEAIALIVLVMTNKIILNLPKTILSTTGTSAWLNTIYISIITLLVVIIILSLFKNFPGYDILDVTNYLGGKILKTVIGSLYIIFFLANAVLILRSFSESIKIIYFDTIPLITIIVFFVATSCIANLFGLKVLSKVNLIVAPLVLLSILVIILASFQDFVPQRLLPILGHGAKQTFLDGTSNLFLYSIIAYLFLIRPMVKNDKSYKTIAIISILISAFYLITSVISLQLVFPFIYETKEHLSIYLLIRMARSGEVIQRFVSVFFFIWILSVLCYISISLFFSTHVTKKLTNLSSSKYITFIFGSLLIGFSLLVSDFSKYTIFINQLFKPIIYVFLFVINPLLLVFANIKFKLKRND